MSKKIFHYAKFQSSSCLISLFFKNLGYFKQQNEFPFCNDLLSIDKSEVSTLTLLGKRLELGSWNFDKMSTSPNL